MITHSYAWYRSVAILIGIFFASVVVSAQDAASATPFGNLFNVPVPAPPGGAPYKFDVAVKTKSTEGVQVSGRRIVRATAAFTPASDGVFRLTLDDAQQAAAGASNPLVRLGELQVEAAKQHRLGVEAQYFPNLSTSYLGLHFNKHPGEVLSAGPPPVAVNIITKDSNAVNLLAVQPITPLFSIYQLAKIARADENIARAKAGMPVAETAMKVEKNFFELLVAQRELTSAEADSKKVQARWLTASGSGVTSISTEQEQEMISAEKAILGPASRVKELTASLDEMLGLPEGTRLELVPPAPLVEDTSLKEVADKAMAANAEVVEAEQTAIKAHAALTLTKLTYVPTVGVLGGYAFQDMINLVLPRSFGYIGASASWTIFDFGKREHGVKESRANAEAADLGVQLTKAKVASAVKSSYLELDRSRKFYQLARRMVSASQFVEASYKPDDPEVTSARAKMEADMFRAELEYRQAYAKVKALMGAQLARAYAHLDSINTGGNGWSGTGKNALHSPEYPARSGMGTGGP
ncbi:MAG TPA: TolC family protein [Candidatus Bathyarchaeia archaeon]|nr:TolC family protein [Candidatus Bathyarchaeia archaeon]